MCFLTEGDGDGYRGQRHDPLDVLDVDVSLYDRLLLRLEIDQPLVDRVAATFVVLGQEDLLLQDELELAPLSCTLCIRDMKVMLMVVC